MYWVPGHAEIAQNEIADQLAKLGAQQAATTSLSHPLTSSEAFKSIKEISSLKWTKRWSHQHNSTDSPDQPPKVAQRRNLRNAQDFLHDA